MSEENEGMLLYLGNDGTFREYDQRNDIVIHCDSEEDRKRLMKKLESFFGDDATDTNVPSKWIPITEQTPDDEPYSKYGIFVNAWMPLPELYKSEEEKQNEADRRRHAEKIYDR